MDDGLVSGVAQAVAASMREFAVGGVGCSRRGVVIGEPVQKRRGILNDGIYRAAFNYFHWL